MSPTIPVIQKSEMLSGRGLNTVCGSYFITTSTSVIMIAAIIQDCLPNLLQFLSTRHNIVNHTANTLSKACFQPIAYLIGPGRASNYCMKATYTTDYD